MKNKIKIIVVIVIILIAVLVGYFLYQDKSKEYEIEEITQMSYFLYQNNNLYGVIDKYGNVIIEPKYEIIQIPNPSKPVFVCMDEYNAETGEYRTVVLNAENSIIFEQFEKVQAIQINTTASKIPYEKSVLLYKQGDKYGLINFEGKKITEPIYEEIKSIDNKEGTLSIKQNGKYGAINAKGTIIVKPEYDTITADNYYNEQTKYKEAGFIISNKTEQGYRYGYINAKGKLLLNAEFTQIDRVTEISEDNIYLIVYENGRAGVRKNKKEIIKHEYEKIEYNEEINMFSVQKNGKQGVINTKGEMILPVDYDNITFAGKCINAQKESYMYVFDEEGNQKENIDFISINTTDDEEYSVTINKEYQYGVTNKSGETVIKNQYSYIEYIKDGFFIATKDNKTGIIDKTGKSVIDLEYDNITKIPNTNVMQANIVENGRIDLIDDNMKKVASLENAMINILNNHIMIYSANDVQYFNFEGNKISNQEIFTNHTLIAKKDENNKWGFVDSKGQIKLPYEYDMVTELNEYGFAGIKKEDKWGVVNENGEIIQEPIYKIDWLQPQFIGKYYLVDLWYGEPYYSNDLE